MQAQTPSQVEQTETKVLEEKLAKTTDKENEQQNLILTKAEAQTQVLRLERLQQLLSKALAYTTIVSGQFDSPIEVPAPKTSKKRGAEETENEVIEDSASSVYQPKLVTGAALRDYQQTGLKWLISLYESGLSGILADEMGLGKTLQCISLLAVLYERGVTGPFLIVAPLSTLSNWKKEFEKFTPSIPVCLYHGTKNERETMARELLKKKKDKSWPAVITSYELILRDASFFGNVHWKYLIIDEGHRIKNMNCKLVRVLKSFQSDNRLLLTGTPLQNNLSELWSLLNFLLPDIFDDLEAFDNWFNFDHLQNESGEQVAVETTKGIIDNLHMILKPFVLRRLKDDVCIGLPKKREYILFATLTKQQRALYDKICMQRQLNKEADENCFVMETIEYNDDGSKRSKRAKRYASYQELDDNEFFDDLKQKVALKYEKSVKTEQQLKRPLKFQNVLMHLRKCCNHPYLFDFPKDEAGEVIVNQEIVDCCGKMQVFDMLLEQLLSRDHRVLVFSQFTSMLDLLAEYLFMKGIDACRIDGEMAQVDRQIQIEEFNENPEQKVFLLSTRAGGLGINLTSADTVILYDSDFNPQMDLQAQDRCHRIGQMKNVIVYRLATQNSVESRILEKAAGKRRLEKVVIHKRKFKSTAASDNAIEIQDLEEILKNDHIENIGDGSDGIETMYSKEDMYALLDRSDDAYTHKVQEGKYFRLVNATASSSLI